MKEVNGIQNLLIRPRHAPNWKARLRNNGRRTQRALRTAVLLFCISLTTSLSLSKTDRRKSFEYARVDSAMRVGFYKSQDTTKLSHTSLYQSAEYSESVRKRFELLDEAETTKRKVRQLLRKNEFGSALQSIKDMLSNAEQASTSESGEEDEILTNVSSLLDETIQTFTNVAFSAPYRGSRTHERVQHGLGAMRLQLSSSGALLPPYDTSPKSTLVLALKAISGVISSGHGYDHGKVQVIDEAFRILQRLVTGMGVRPVEKPSAPILSEREFNMFLNAVCKAGRLDVARKIFGLQERVPNAPPLSPVPYSILLKGYGRLGDARSVDRILSHAQMNKIRPDRIMLNSAMDAYVNCGEVELARDIFDYMTDSEFDLNRLSRFGSLFRSDLRPVPDRRTYNTMLKGLARQGNIHSAQELAGTMRDLEFWDDITTNTLVNAAVSVQDFDLAERVLANHTSAPPSLKSDRSDRHPNVEAYTALLGGYAKASRLDKAMGALQLMRQRGVEPNAYTYACAIGALARVKRVEQAHKLLEFMESTGLSPNVVVFNAYITGLVSENESIVDDQQIPHDDEKFDGYVNEAIIVLRTMLNKGVRPNSVTVSVLVDAFGRCEAPRIDEAKALVRKLVKDGIIAEDNNMIATSLIRTCGLGRDLKGAVHVFGNIDAPDTVAVNAFMETCCQCQHEKMAFDTFEHFFGNHRLGKIQPDVISYTVLIKALLKCNAPLSVEKSRRLYNDMKNKRRIRSDRALVDIILNALLRVGRMGLQKKDIAFALNVLRDAKGLDWAPGEYEKRRRAVRAVMMGRMSEMRKADGSWYGIRAEEEDPFLRRHGWNKVDSGFSIWGHGGSEQSVEQIPGEFLRKGWNDVDSGFRII